MNLWMLRIFTPVSYKTVSLWFAAPHPAPACNNSSTSWASPKSLAATRAACRASSLPVDGRVLPVQSQGDQFFEWLFNFDPSGTSLFSGFLFNTHSDTSNQPRIPLSNCFFSFLDLSSVFYSPKLGSQSFPKDSIHSPSSVPGEISKAATAWVKDSATFLDQRKKPEAWSCCNVGTS